MPKLKRKSLFLVCNAHLDPAWLWQWEEGLAETLSTFRTAVRFCEEFEGFAFCHNEALLYQWVESYEPELFHRIQRLVERGKWYIIGGWYVQPDCNLPSGESFVRQILVGKSYFMEKFNVEPATAVNFDPFGHSRGLVQILKKSGYSSYLFCRPDEKFMHLENDDFVWTGYDGSEITAHRASDHYNSEMGKAREKIERWISKNPDRRAGLLLWGIGNHGGGPSATDLEQIEDLRNTQNDWYIIHSKPEDYFSALKENPETLPRISLGLNPWAVGCYTSMARVKRTHRLLENSYYASERMLAVAAVQGLMEYPDKELRLALEDLLFCEFQPPEPNFDGDLFLQPELVDNSANQVTFQLEKESCNIKVDQRKRVVFSATLKASSMNRFSCYLRKIDADSVSISDGQPETFRFQSDTCDVEINADTGLIDHYRINGVDFLCPDSFKPLVMDDYADPWGMKVRSFRKVIGSFSLMTEEESAEFAGVSVSKLKPVHVIDQGSVRSIVEVLMQYRHSTLCMRYKIPRIGNEIEIELTVYWMEKDRMLKLSIPTLFKDGTCRGQDAYGIAEVDRYGEELVAQKWVGVTSSDRQSALTVINDSTYGFDFKEGELRSSLLRSPAYSGHPVGDDLSIVLPDRFEPRIDQGKHTFRFWLNAGEAADRYSRIDREATVKNGPPMSLCCYPKGTGIKVPQGVTLSDDVIQLTALKMSEDGKRLILRLFEPTGHTRKTQVTVPCLQMEFGVAFSGFELKTLAIDLDSKTVFETDLLERRHSE